MGGFNAYSEFRQGVVLQMKKLLFAFLFLSSICGASTPTDFQQSRNSMSTVSAPAVGNMTPLIGSGIQYHQLVWNITGTVSTCTVALDSSADGNSWTAGGAITSQVCTTNGSSAVINGVFNNVRPNVTAMSGGGTVQVAYLGWTSSPVTMTGPISSTVNSVPTYNGTSGSPLQDPGVCSISGGVFSCSGAMKATAIQTLTNCATNSSSPAACGSASSGVVAIPSLTTSYTINTTAVTSTSRIFLTPTLDNTGIPSSPSCVGLALTAIASISARVAGTSFTFTLPSTIGSTCIQFWIVN